MKFRHLQHISIIGLGLFYGSILFAQGLPNIMPNIPKASTFQAITPNHYTKRVITPTHPFQNKRNQKQMQMAAADLRRASQMAQRQQAMRQDINNSFRTISYTLPSYHNQSGAVFYRKALDSLLKMDPDNFSIKKATFIIENAFYANTKDYKEFERTIASTGEFIKKVMQQQGLETTNNLVKNLTIYKYMSDTLTVDGKKHYPYSYDFEDYMGEKNLNKTFVEKLIREGKGQCASLPQYYLILAEELEADAQLAFAPNHSFVKFRDPKGDWYNVELTTGAIMTDASMLSAGYIKSEALINGNYITPQSNRQLMAHLFNVLAGGYIHKYGRDNFSNKIVEHALALNPTGIPTNLMKNNYLLERLRYIMHQIGTKDLNELKSFPKAQTVYEELDKQHQKIKDLGFQEMPEKQYKAWLSSLKKEKDRQDKQKLKDSFKENTLLKN